MRFVRVFRVVKLFKFNKSLRHLINALTVIFHLISIREKRDTNTNTDATDTNTDTPHMQY